VDDLREGAERAFFDKARLSELYAPRLNIVLRLSMKPKTDEGVPFV